MNLKIFGVLLLSHVVASQDTRVVNGTDAKEGEYPYMISLRYNDNHRCGGTVLNANHVMTAAHCMCEGDQAAWYAPLSTIQYGILHVMANDTQSIGVKDTYCHSYNSSAYHIYDVAILSLNESIPEEYLHRVILEDRIVSNETKDAVVVGWGRNFTNGYAQTVLQVGEVLLYNDTICDRAFNGYVDIEHHVCAGWPENGRGSCQGDSGGPLIVDGYQVGIVSFGASGNCGISNTSLPKVLSRVASYIDFIKEKAGDDVLLASEVDSSTSVTACVITVFLATVCALLL